MGVVIGSARIDERGKASGGAAGDQKQTKTPDYSGEVSFQEWYLHSKGWVVARAKDPSAREKIAQDMEFACNNANIGYDQSQNTSLYSVSKPLGFNCSKVTTKCETDCAKLVRVCVLYAGINADDFYTANEIEALKKTGAFTIYTADKYCKSSDYLMRGDILCTKVKGHTVVVLSNGVKVKNSGSDEPSQNVAVYQTFLNTYYASQTAAAAGALLDVDNQYGAKTRAASVSVWKYMANKYYGANLTVGNSNFLTACKAVAGKMTLDSIETHPTMKKILQGVLAGRNYYSGLIDGIIGEGTRAGIKLLQKSAGLPETGELTADTWYSLFN